MSDWTASEAREFLSIIREEAEKAAKNFGDKQSSVYACLAVVTDVSESGSISVRLLSSPSDGSQDFVVRNRSGSTLEVGDSVWLHYWSDYTNVYIAVRNMGDTGTDITATGIGALSYAEAQTLTAGQKTQALSNAGAAPALHATQHAIGAADAINALPYDATSSNLLINGGFDVWQRGTSFSSGYTADRWRIDFNGIGATRAITRQAFTAGQTAVPSNPTYYLRYAQSVAGSGTTYNLLVQRIEDVSMLSGKTATLSFYAKADSARNIATQVDQTFGSGGSSTVYVGEVAHSLTTSWQRFTRTLTFPSVSGKTIGANSFVGLYFVMPLNTTFTIDIANVQLNYGSAALPFVPRSYADELRLCQRYYLGGVGTLCAGYVSGAVANIHIHTPVTMRTTPTPTIVTGDNFVYSNTFKGISSVASISMIAGVGISLSLNLASTTGGLFSGVIASLVVNLDSEL